MDISVLSYGILLEEPKDPPPPSHPQVQKIKEDLDL